MTNIDLTVQPPLPRFALVLRLLRTAGANLAPAPLKDGRPDPNGEACVLIHSMPADSGLPDVAWWMASVRDLDPVWRHVAKGWQARSALTDAVTQAFVEAAPNERALMLDWQRTSSEKRLRHPWNGRAQAIAAQSEAKHQALSTGWRARSIRTYIDSVHHDFGQDLMGDAILKAAAVNPSIITTFSPRRPKF